jgi:VWFA-related protein
MRYQHPLAGAFLLAAAALAAPVAAQQAEVLETELTTFRFPVVVTHKKKFVGDLKESEFLVTEDGVPQKLTVFATTTAPLNVVFMVDSSPSMQAKLVPVKKALAQFIRRLRPEDRAKVVRFNDTPETMQAFTSDQEALLAAIQKIEVGGDTSLRNALYGTLEEMAVESSAAIARRAVVVLSDGEDTGSFMTVDDVLDAARRVRDVVVYTISLDPPSGVQSPLAVQGRELLDGLARVTGGDVLTTDLGNVDEIYDRISRELSVQYLLGYSPKARSGDRWRNIVVTVPGRKGLQIRHRPGYLQEKPSAR